MEEGISYAQSHSSYFILEEEVQNKLFEIKNPPCPKGAGF
jgi:hypothetical protein